MQIGAVGQLFLQEGGLLIVLPGHAALIRLVFGCLHALCLVFVFLIRLGSHLFVFAYLALACLSLLVLLAQCLIALLWLGFVLVLGVFFDDGIAGQLGVLAGDGGVLKVLLFVLLELDEDLASMLQALQKVGLGGSKGGFLPVLNNHCIQI